MILHPSNRRQVHNQEAENTPHTSSSAGLISPSAFVSRAYHQVTHLFDRSAPPPLLLGNLPRHDRWLRRRFAHGITAALLAGALTVNIPASRPVQAANPLATFTIPRDNGTPFNQFRVDYYAAPAFGDLDADGDLDAIVGEESEPKNHGVLTFFENVGSNTAPEFIVQVGAANPFDNTYIYDDYLNPALVDIDDDGDLDAFIGLENGTMYFFENTGTPTAPAFTKRTAGANPFYDTGGNVYIDVGSNAAILTWAVMPRLRSPIRTTTGTSMPS